MQWLSKAIAAVVVAGFMLTAVGHADPGDELVALINAYRTQPHDCDGQRMPARSAFAPSAGLRDVTLPPGESLTAALRAAGYQAARSMMINIDGPPTPASAMTVLERRYCASLMSPEYSEIGVAHSGNTWRIVLGQPVVAGNLGDWQTAGRAVLALVNAKRSQVQQCGRQRMAAVPPLTWNDKLAAAALSHSRDMADRDYFSHLAPDGTSVEDRVARAGYRWRAIGENIAAGQGSPEKVVAAWMASPEHCANIMSPEFAETGVAYATRPGSDMFIYWTEVFGAGG